MNHRSVLAHGILAAGGLVLAYLVWTDDSTPAPEGEVTIFECDAHAIGRVELTSDDKDVALELTRDDDALLAWISVTERPDEGEPRSKRFVGSEAVEDYLAQVAPLRARRSLGDLSDEDLTAVGLNEPEGRFTLVCGSRRETFLLGSRAYGQGDRYARKERGGPVYLVASDRIAPLEAAERQLMQRQLHTFEWPDVESLVVRAHGVEKRLLQRNRLDPQRAQWVDAQEPDRRNELYGNWLSSYPRLRVQEYLPADAGPGSDLEDANVAASPVMRLEMHGEGGRLGYAEIQRVQASPVAYYARTETTGGWVRVPPSVARSLEEDLRPVLGLEELPEPEESRSEAALREGTAEGAETGVGVEGASETGTEAGTESEPRTESGTRTGTSETAGHGAPASAED